MRVVLPTLALSLCAFAQTARPTFSLEQHVQLGGSMTPAAAGQIEAQLEKNPHDILARAKLLGYYYYQWMQVGERDAKAARQRHIIWTIQHQSDSPLAGLYEATIDPRGHSLADAEGYDKARQLWLERMESKPPSAPALGNAAKFFQLFDKELAEKALQRALEIDPRNGEWHWRLGYLYAIGILGIDGLAFNGQPTSVDPVARDGPFAAKARRELETSSDPVMIAVAGNVLSQYGTMLAPSEKARVGHLVEAEKLFRRAQVLDPNNPTWKQMLQRAQALKAQMTAPGQ